MALHPATNYDIYIYQPLLTIINHYYPFLTMIIHYSPLLSIINHY